MSIGRELYSALKQLRKVNEEGELGIWVDALCIDQNDMAERNEHVKMMGEIYANSDSVRVWLGEEVDVEEMALLVLDEVNRKFNELFGGAWDGDRGMVEYDFVNDQKD